jgi:hypothetical protein
MKEASYCQYEHNKYLGGHCHLGGDKVAKKTFKNFPKHEKIKIFASLHFLDNWEGESAIVKANGSPVWMKSMHTSSVSIDLCGGNFKEAALSV